MVYLLVLRRLWSPCVSAFAAFASVDEKASIQPKVRGFTRNYFQRFRLKSFLTGKMVGSSKVKILTIAH